MNSIWDHNAMAEARKALGMAQDAAAGFLNITPEYLSMVENAKKSPSQNLVARMATLYCVPVVNFLAGEKVKLSA